MVEKINRKKYQNNLYDRLLKSFEYHGVLNVITSVIITGSFGRDEETYEVTEDSIKLKSDVEIGVVYKTIKAGKFIWSKLDNIYNEFEEELNIMPLMERRMIKALNSNQSIISPKYKTMLTFDIFNGSKTIWGYDYINKKNVTINELDKYEAKRIVANRIGELTYLLKKEPENVYLKYQWYGKLMLAIGSAWLICNSKYASSATVQMQEILNNKEKINNLLGKSFVDEYYKCFMFLRQNGSVYKVKDQGLRMYIKNINQFLKKQELNKSLTTSTTRHIKYLRNYIKSREKCEFWNMENYILQGLIESYQNNSNDLYKFSNIWHNIIY